MALTVTMHYGRTNMLTRDDVEEGTTFDQLLADPRNQAALRYGNNVEVLLGSVPQSGSNTVFDGAEITIHNRACTKQ